MNVRRLARAEQTGFSLIELMIAVGIAGILLALAAPSLTRIIARQRISATASDFSADLALARSEAARTGSSVGVCASADGASCGGSWTDGWVVWVDRNSNGSIDSTEAGVVRSRLSGRATPTVTESASASSVVFGASGALRSPARTWTICVPGEIGKVVAVMVGGPINVYATTASCN